MQTIQILAVGAMKNAAFDAACREYLKRLGMYCKPSVVEIAEYRLPKNPSEADIQQGIAQESSRIADKLPPKAFVVALCVNGTRLSSPQLAKKLAETSQTHSQLAFVIGGSHGMSAELEARADLRLSMSDMTFPHQLARVMLLEQLYRAFSIIHGGKYHK